MKQLRPTESLKNPNAYVVALTSQYRAWAFTEVEVAQFKGQWREQVFQVPNSTALDLEIGTGNGFHFAHRTELHPERSLIGFEWKYKPLIQSIRRARIGGATNARIARFDASRITEAFAPNELNQVFIHFPDPWPKLRQHKHRLLQSSFLTGLYQCQQAASSVEIKTDNYDYFLFALSEILKSPYQIVSLSTQWQQHPESQESLRTQFETLFIRQGLPIYRVVLTKTN